MTTTPLVSVIIPVYNRERFLSQAISSVLLQAFTDFELIICDDGSTDKSLEIANIYAKLDSRVLVLTEKINHGAAYTLRKGYAAAHPKSIYICQLDSDDSFDGDTLGKTVAVLDENPDCGLVYTNYIEIDEFGNKLRPGRRCSIPYSRDRLLVDFMTFHFRLIRKTVYAKTGGFNLEFNNIEDYELCLRLSEIANIRKIDDYLYLYRFHADSTKVTMDELERINLCKKAITQALKRRGMEATHKVSVSFNPTFFIDSIS